MSHGGGGGARASPDDFGRAVSNLAVAQLCQAAGFHSVNDSALQAFTDVTIRYLVDLGKTAHFYSNLSGRSQSSVFDLILGLQDLEQRAPPSQSQQQCLVGSSIVCDLVNYVNNDNDNLVDNEVPFSQPIPNFPVIRYPRIIPSFVQLGEAPPCKHIPNWLPALPDPHTYIHTPVWNERASDPREDKIEQARQRRKAERSLLSLQKRLLLSSSSCNGLPETSADKNSSIRVNVTPPPPESNKDVSPVALQSKVLSEEAVVDANHVSVLEAFAPAIEMLRDGGLFDDGPEGKTVLPAVRPTVHFKFRTGKKLIGESLDNRQQNKGALRTASLAGREDERDDKKRRAEYILKQSMENTQELTLL